MKSSNPDIGPRPHGVHVPANANLDDDSEPEMGGIPMAPIDLARGYATLAFKVNDTMEKRLPRLEADLDQTKGIALAAHGLAAETRARIEDIAIAVKAPSSAMKAAVNSARSVPPPPPEKLEVQYTTSPTGTHLLVKQEELDRLQRKFDNQEAEKRGAREALADLLTKEELDRKRAKASRERWMLIAVVLGTAFAIATYALEHLAFHR
jgi:hypothetical protein